MTRIERNSGLDLVRAFAILFVLSVHFFLNTYFYSTPLTGKNMFIETFFRMSFMICVPLFMILTGYLQSNKMPVKSYYKNILPIIIIYVFYSVLSLFYNKFWLHDKKGLMEFIASIFNFSADGYSWYINMYIGLFLLSPFLNILYKNIPTKKQKIIFLFSLMFITSLPNFLNGFIGEKILFSPDYWVQMYPLTYYFIGSFIKEFNLKINKIRGIFFFIILTLISASLEFFYAKNGNFISAVGAFPSLIIVFQSLIFFLIFYDINLKNKLLSKFITLISILSLDIYLASFVTDKIVYKYFLNKYLYYPQQKIFFFFPVIVLSTFSLAFFLSFIRHKTVKIR